MSPRTLEVCVDSFESAMIAIASGAKRLELCSSLSEGGLTPTPGLLIQVQHANAAKIPIYCMLRCRGGNFIYTPEEMNVMKEDTKILRKYNADGFVFGALLENRDVDMANCREIIKSAFPLPVTFHRAFDFCKRPTIEIEVIIDLGFTRILTSGQQKNAQLGVKLISKLMEQVGNRIIIMPGGGVTVDNLKFIMENTEAVEFHGSFRKLKEHEKEVGENKNNGNAKSDKEHDKEDTIRLGDSETSLYITDEIKIKKVLDILNDC